MDKRVVFRIRDPDPISLSVGDPVVKSDILPAYEGPYNIIPTTVEQVLNTKNKALSDVITIAPIPQNYGLITWNGSTITVS